MSEKINIKGGSVMVWHGKEVSRLIHGQMRRRVIVATAVLKAAVMKALSIPTRAKGPSKPGEIPHRFDGLLIKSIYGLPQPSNREGTEGRVGTKLKYGIFHETTLRPFLRPTLDAQRSILTVILMGGR